MKWKMPRKIKIYEAIGCVEEGRVFVYKNKGEGVPNYDYNTVKKEIEDIIIKRGVNIEEFGKYVEKVENDLKTKKLNLLGEKQEPPKGF